MGCHDAPPGWWKEFVGALPPEMLVRVHVDRVVARVDIDE
jgi:hypothetical protein